MPRETQIDLAGPESYLRAVRGTGANDLREKYRGDPIGLAESLGLIIPEKPARIMVRLGIVSEEEAIERWGPRALSPGLKELIEDVCVGRVESAAAVANRGGGKSMGVSFIEFYKVFVDDFDALNLGGSELQADNVYQYLLGYLDSSPYWKTIVRGDTQREKTFTIHNAWIRVLTASSKSVRSPHAGGKKKDGRLAGGLLVIDEEAEADPDIVLSALPTINTAVPSVNVRCSTFHNAEGTFADLIDNHVSMGYELYAWDTFDTCARCECVGKCQSPEPCFREDHVEKVQNPETGEVEDKLVHKAYCGGKAMYADGWIPVVEIEKLWQRFMRNHAKFEVEAMGSRPKSSGYVIKDLFAYAQNIMPLSPAEAYQKGASVTICIDWGSVNAGVTVWQEQYPNAVQLHADLLEENGLTQILGVALGYVQLYEQDFLEIAADIGGGGGYNNPHLREVYNLPVRDVNFAEEKELGAAAWNIFNEAGRAKYLECNEEMHRQIRKWKRKNGRIQKGNDHLPDSSICFFTKFASQLGVQLTRVGGVSFSSAVETGPREAPESPANASYNRSGVPILSRPITATPKGRR